MQSTLAADRIVGPETVRGVEEACGNVGPLEVPVHIAREALNWSFVVGSNASDLHHQLLRSRVFLV